MKINQKTRGKPGKKLTASMNSAKLYFSNMGKSQHNIPATTAEKSLHHSEQSQMHHCGTIILCTGIKLVF